jgi:hypothetical protein
MRRQRQVRLPASTVSGALFLVWSLLVFLLICVTAGCPSNWWTCGDAHPCQTDADCSPGVICLFPDSSGGCLHGCQIVWCESHQEFACPREDLICYTDPDEHPFPEWAARQISSVDGEVTVGVCYYPPGESRIPDYDE